MAMLSRRAIQQLMKMGLIEVEPEPTRIGPNSIDLHLGDSLKRYDRDAKDAWQWVHDPVSGLLWAAIDPKHPPPLVDVPKTEDGRWLLTPGNFYLGVTRERTSTRGVVPHLDGRSTCGRLSIEVHKTAGVGDNGYDGRWTLEIETTEAVLVSPGDRLLQVYFSPCWGPGIAKYIEKGMWPKTGGDLIELHDHYGTDEGHHYQGSTDAIAAAPLDD